MDSQKGEVSGRLRVRFPPGFSPEKKVCFYLPYNDAVYDVDPLRGLELIPRRYAELLPEKGYTKLTRWQGKQPHLQQNQTPTLATIHLDTFEEEFFLEFRSRPPRWFNSNAKEWFFGDFYPQLLSACPPADTPVSVSRLEFASLIHLTGEMTIPSKPNKWTIITPAKMGTSHEADASYERISYDFTGQKLVLALSDTHRVWSFKWNDQAVEMVGRTEEFLKFVPFLERTFLAQQKIFGSLPFPKIIFFESTESYKSAIPGFIVINRSEQLGISMVQEEATHWMYWQLAAFTAEQWYGAAIQPKNWDHMWLAKGLIDLGAYVALLNNKAYFSLFGGSTEDEENPLRFDYRQSQDLISAALRYFDPYARLTDEKFQPRSSFATQHGLTYVRASQMFRHLRWFLGKETFAKLLKEITEDFAGNALDAASFAEKIRIKAKSLLTPAQAQAVQNLLFHWWTKDEWPDFWIENISETYNADTQRWQVKVWLREKQGFSSPVQVRIRDETEQDYFAESQKVEGTADQRVAEFNLVQKLDQVHVEPTHEVFDWDRFNNTNLFPRFYFFPGNLRTLTDDGYSIFWLPLLKKLPGEPLNLYLMAETLKYIHSSTTAIFNYSPDSKETGYSLYYLKDFPKAGVYAVFDIFQNQGQSYKGERLAEAGVYKTLSSSKDPLIDVGFRLRGRETVGKEDTSRHGTIALRTTMVPINQYGDCLYSVKADSEWSFYAVDRAGHYNRNFFLSETTCKVVEPIETSLRLFAGNLTRQGRINRNIMFNPQDITEARLRIDDPKLPKVDRILTTGVDLMVPTYIPFPKSLFILARQSRWRLFYDYGVAGGEHHSVFQDAGFGIWMPFGADLVGKSDFQILNFSFLLVLFKQVDQENSFKPGIVFDFDFFGKI